MKTFIKKNKYNIFVFFSFLLFFGIAHYFSPLTNLDELWKYNHSKAIVDGFIPYKEFNLITTPFYFFLTSLFLIPNSTLFAFRIYSWFFNTIFFFIMYSIIEKKSNKHIAFILSTLCLCFLTIADNFIYIFDYNRLFLLIVFLCIYLDFKIKIKSKKYYFVLGLLYALLILTKQSSGIVLFIFATIYLIIKNKKIIKNILCYMIGFIFPNIMFLVYLLINDALIDFFNYCLFGLSDFTNNQITFLSLFTTNLYYSILCTFVLFSFVLLIIYCLKTKEMIYLIYFISIGLLAYPICDINHFNLVVIISLYANCLFYNHLFKNGDVKTILDKLKILKSKMFWYFFVYIFGAFICFIVYIKPIICSDIYKHCTLTNLENIYIPQKGEYGYFMLNNYINDNYGVDNVLFLSSNSVFISTMNDTNAGIFDNFFYGNLGNISFIEHIEKAMENKTIICISNNYKEENWQNIPEVYDYVIDNYNYIDTYGKYSFYQR